MCILLRHKLFWCKKFFRKKHHPLSCPCSDLKRTFSPWGYSMQASSSWLNFPKSSNHHASSAGTIPEHCLFCKSSTRTRQNTHTHALTQPWCVWLCVSALFVINLMLLEWQGVGRRRSARTHNCKRAHHYQAFSPRNTLTMPLLEPLELAWSLSFLCHMNLT